MAGQYLELIQGDQVITLDFGNNEGSRGAVISGLYQVRDQVGVLAWEVDEKGRRYEKEVQGQ